MVDVVVVVVAVADGSGGGVLNVVVIFVEVVAGEAVDVVVFVVIDEMVDVVFVVVGVNQLNMVGVVFFVEIDVVVDVLVVVLFVVVRRHPNSLKPSQKRCSSSFGSNSQSQSSAIPFIRMTIFVTFLFNCFNKHELTLACFVSSKRMLRMFANGLAA